MQVWCYKSAGSKFKLISLIVITKPSYYSKIEPFDETFFENLQHKSVLSKYLARN